MNRVNLASSRAKGAKFDLPRLGLTPPLSREAAKRNETTYLNITRRPSRWFNEVVSIQVLFANKAVKADAYEIVGTTLANNVGQRVYNAAAYLKYRPPWSTANCTLISI